MRKCPRCLSRCWITVGAALMLGAGCLDPLKPPVPAPAKAEAQVDEARLAGLLERVGVRCSAYETHVANKGSGFEIKWRDDLAVRDFKEYLAKTSGTALERIQRAAQEAVIHAPNLEIIMCLRPATKVPRAEMLEQLGPSQEVTTEFITDSVEDEEIEEGRSETRQISVTWHTYGWCRLGVYDDQIKAIKVKLQPFKPSGDVWKEARLRKGY